MKTPPPAPPTSCAGFQVATILDGHLSGTRRHHHVEEPGSRWVDRRQHWRRYLATRQLPVVKRTIPVLLAAFSFLQWCSPARAVIVDFFDASQSFSLVQSGTTSDTVSTEG